MLNKMVGFWFLFFYFVNGSIYFLKEILMVLEYNLRMSFIMIGVDKIIGRVKYSFCVRIL